MIVLSTRRRLLRSIDAERVGKAIRNAERRTSGEIRVSVASFFWGDVRRTAERVFERMGMTGTRDRNGVLLFVVPSRRRLVVLGDRGIHEKVGPEFWAKIADGLAGRFRERDFTGGLVNAIEVVGRELAAHFPYDAAADKNELPDDIEYR